MMFRTWKFAVLAVAVLGSQSSFAICLEGYEFPKFESLTLTQQQLLTSFLPDANTAFTEWSSGHDNLSTEFLANTQALSKLYLELPNHEWILSTQMILGVNKILGDRVKYDIDNAIFSSWREAGANYKILKQDGTVEMGKFKFDHGDLGGSLHHTYTTQGYTSVTRVPRIQINYRSADHEADIDIDAYAPWIEHVLPDPIHLTYKNSDPRCWLSRFEKKYGSIGVLLRKQTREQTLDKDVEPIGSDSLVEPTLQKRN